jgi:hypothetical protein
MSSNAAAASYSAVARIGESAPPSRPAGGRDGAAQVARRRLLSALLIHCSRALLADLLRQRFVRIEQRERFAVGLLGLRVLGAIEVRVSEHDPAGAQLLEARRRLPRDEMLRGVDRGLVLAELEQLLRGAREHDRRLRVIRERVGEAQRRIARLAMPRRALGLRQAFFVLRVGQQRGVARLRGVCVRPVLVGDALVLDRRFVVTLALVQDLGEEETRVGGFGLLREGLEPGAIPVDRLLVVGGIVIGLGARVVVLRKLGQVQLELRGHFGRIGGRARRPVRLAERVVLDELHLRCQHLIGEACLLVGVDDGELQERSARMRRLTRDEGAIALRRVVVAFLREIEIAEALVHDVLVTHRSRVEERARRFDAAEIGETDADRAQRVVHELAVRTRELRQGVHAVGLRGERDRAG